ncbi:MAG: GHKL domain-containing protein [Lachnospiraceae bacterium]|nr:GHKL domain-containing protein [Lachnospiraceae bacterium]
MLSKGLYIGLNLIMELLFSLVVYEYFSVFYDRKNIKLVFIYVFLINVIVQIVQKHIPVNMSYWRVVLSVVVLIGISFFFTGGVKEHVVFAVLFIALSMLGELLIACIFVAYDIADTLYEVGYIVTYAGLLMFIFWLQHYFRNIIIGNMSWKTYFKIMLLPMGSMFLAYRIFYSQYEMGIRGFYWKTIISIIILWCINIIVFNIFAQISENLELRRKADIYEKEFALLEQHMHERENLMKEFRTKRHDLKHQMLNLLDLLYKKDYVKLESDIKKLAELDSLKSLFLVNTENSIIDTFVNSKYTISRENGICFVANLNIPSEIPFSGEDISIILGNALDNAMEACLRGKVKNPYIKLEISYNQGNLAIMVENSFDGILKRERKGGWVTRKGDFLQHGIGIQSMRNVIRKYNGYYHVNVIGGVYHLDMILYSLEN